MEGLELRTMPEKAIMVLRELRPDTRLIAHLSIVHDVASRLVEAIDMAWPGLAYDRDAVLIGAALHDAGKVRYPEEIAGPGRRHENDGPALLIEHGLQEEYARFARTHAQWAHEAASTLEDLLVALADEAWMGRRNDRLETTLVDRLTSLTHEEPWETFSKLDDILQLVGEDASRRLAWYAQFTENGNAASTPNTSNASD